MAVGFYVANKSFVVIILLICSSVDLQETFLIVNIYKAQIHTVKHTHITEAYVNLNAKVKRFC